MESMAYETMENHGKHGKHGYLQKWSMEGMGSILFSGILLLIISRKDGKHGKHGIYGNEFRSLWFSGFSDLY